MRWSTSSRSLCEVEYLQSEFLWGGMPVAGVVDLRLGEGLQDGTAHGSVFIFEDCRSLAGSRGSLIDYPGPQICGIRLACPWIAMPWVAHIPGLVAAPVVDTKEIIAPEKLHLSISKVLV